MPVKNPKDHEHDRKESRETILTTDMLELCFSTLVYVHEPSRLMLAYNIIAL